MRWEIKDLLEIKVLRVLMVLKEIVGKKEREGIGDFGDLKVLRERKGIREWKELLEMLDWEEKEE